MRHSVPEIIGWVKWAIDYNSRFARRGRIGDFYIQGYLRA